MATATVNSFEVAESLGHSDRNEFDVVFHATEQQITEDSIFIGTINNTPSNDDLKTTLYSQESRENPDFNVHTETTGSSSSSSSHENDEKENISTNDPKKSVVRRKYRNILDSDSEEEDNFISSLLNKSYLEKESNENLEMHDENTLKVSGTSQRAKNSRRLIDSESDEDMTIVDTNISNDGNDNNCNDNENIRDVVVKNPLKSRFRTLVDSDSEVDNELKNPNSPIKNNECEPSDESKKANAGEKKKKPKISMIVDSESDYENDSNHSAPVTNKKKPVSNRKKKAKVYKSKGKSKISDLNTDSEGGTKHDIFEQSSLNESEENAVPSKKKTKRRTGSVRAAKDEAMRQIHSETQRLIRSSEVSLPYHRPKQRSLQDFLNRKQFIPVLPEGLTTAAKVKMSSEIVGKVLKEKEKEAELFYKSSDSEDETITCTPHNLNPIKEISSSGMLVEQIAIEETQKIHNNDIQNAHKKKEIIQQGAIDIGVPRKLFLDEPNDLMENDQPTNVEINMDDDDDLAVVDPRKKIKEIKNGLRDGNAPRKLFASHHDKGVDSPPQNNDASITMTGMSNVETRKLIEPEVVSVDEGIHSLSKINEISSSSEADGNDLVLKLPDSALADSPCDENLAEMDSAVYNNKPADATTESFNISETPFISSKEYAKLNEREKSSKHNDNFDVTSDIDDDSSESAFDHVIGLPPPDMEINPVGMTTSSIKKKVLSTLSKVGPKLRGTPGMMIDFSDDVRPNKEGVKSLVDRFMRHSAVNKPIEKFSPVTVLHTEKTANGLNVIEEILPYKLPTGDNLNDKELQKPGAKYAKLKNDLIRKMATKRGEEWKLKEQQEKDENKDDIEDESDTEADVRLADEEFECSTESEPEEDDMPTVRKKKRKHRQFADEEAEVSREEEEDGDDVMEVSDDEEDEEDGEEEMIANDHDADASNNFSDIEEETAKKTKRLSRIVKAFEDDSNSLPDESFGGGTDCRAKVFERTKTDVDMFAPENNDGWLSDAEGELPPSQILPRDQADARSQLCKTPLTAINVLRFVSPITQLTALNSCMDSPKDSPLLSDVSRTSHGILGLSTENTPIGVKESPISCDNEKKIGFQKKLFEDPAGTVNDEELMDICSGKFTCMENEDGRRIDAMRIMSHEKVSETQLMSLCSGSFTSQMIDADKYENNVKRTVDETLQDIRLTLDDDSNPSCDIAPSKETRIESKSSWTFQVATSSDDEISSNPQNGGKKKILKKKKVQKLDLSDDEDEKELSNEEEYDEVSVIDNEEKYVDYDSEENEVIIPKKDMKKVAADFFEAEAELSESEWGSADEDEKDLDRFEFEEADNEEIDEDKMRDQLGKIHMRQVQDDDQREVRMLQELLFDDGDLHTDGSGRERKFKWKNIDQLGEDGTIGPLNNDGDENGGPIEEDNDLEWRKERLEREKFIEDKMKLATDEVIDELGDDSQVFKLGMKALKKSKSSRPSQNEADPAITKPVVPRTVLDLVGSPSLGSRIVHKAVKRGSFLARGDECLARLAVHIKQTSETTILTRKNAGNFVFTHISPSVGSTADKHQTDSTKENSSDKTMARKRKPTAGVTPRSTKKAKVDITRSTGKKLF